MVIETMRVNIENQKKEVSMRYSITAIELHELYYYVPIDYFINRYIYH
jgi:hypothetical protein